MLSIKHRSWIYFPYPHSSHQHLQAAGRLSELCPRLLLEVFWSTLSAKKMGTFQINEQEILFSKDLRTELHCFFKCRGITRQQRDCWGCVSRKAVDHLLYKSKERFYSPLMNLKQLSRSFWTQFLPSWIYPGKLGGLIFFHIPRLPSYVRRILQRILNCIQMKVSDTFSICSVDLEDYARRSLSSCLACRLAPIYPLQSKDVMVWGAWIGPSCLGMLLLTVLRKSDAEWMGPSEAMLVLKYFG